jgi:hypothetical protein
MLLEPPCALDQYRVAEVVRAVAVRVQSRCMLRLVGKVPLHLFATLSPGVVLQTMVWPLILIYAKAGPNLPKCVHFSGQYR